ncbi:MAG: MotA/TolQ/ExbB proton channel family protein [Pirellulales bacterium]|nr:MotA/TolQ/ExbB proton channel family protein [Pirellulales bacterium]
MANQPTPTQSISIGPILWGAVATAGFYGLIHTGAIQHELITRYFASHPVEYITTGLFFFGLFTLLGKAMGVLAQNFDPTKSVLGAVRTGGHSPSECDALIAGLDQLSPNQQRGYLVRRLREALVHVKRKNSAAQLDEELRYLSDIDAARMHASYGLVRVIIWAIPILGFLGTVIGITLAVANLSPEALETSLPLVTSGLGVAFDTTALSLMLSIVLMFTQFIVDRMETRLLDKVDSMVASELVGRFQEVGTGTDPQLASVRNMVEQSIRGTEQLVQKQIEMWQQTIDAAHRHWASLVSGTKEQLEESLAVAMSKSLEQHAQAIENTQRKAAKFNRRHWTRVAESFEQSAAAVTQQQAELVKQGDVLLQVVDATGQVTKLEDALNHNLAALGSSKDFEEMVISLSAAIQLLATKMGGDRGHVDLSNKTTGQAA